MLKPFLQIGALVFVAELVRPIGDEVFRRWGKAQLVQAALVVFREHVFNLATGNEGQNVIWIIRGGGSPASCW